jgi:hypothetical protein
MTHARGKRRHHGTKATVEQFLILDAHTLVRDHGVRPGSTGTLICTDPPTGKCTALADFSIDVRDADEDSLTLQLSTSGGGEAVSSIPIEATFPHIGGRRWWFLCPYCGERRARLYYRRGSFLCRVCHDLTYRSCQQAHHVEREIRREERDRKRFERMFEGLSAERQKQLAPFALSSSLRAYAREPR